MTTPLSKLQAQASRAADDAAPPPLLSTWPRVYKAVLVVELALIVGLWLLARVWP